MGKKIDLVGKVFGRLTVLEDTGKRNNSRRIIYLCKCECGNVVEVDRLNLMSGDTQSCGCWYKDSRTKHNSSHTKLYRKWADMIQRCENKKSTNYEFYGGKGVKVCKDWHDFKTFQDWATNHGYRPGLSIDRIDASGNYKPENCRWATRKEQDRNKRNTIFVEINGEKMCLKDVSKLYGISYPTLQNRYRNGSRGEKLLIPKHQGVKLNITPTK